VLQIALTIVTHLGSRNLVGPVRWVQGQDVTFAPSYFHDYTRAAAPRRPLGSVPVLWSFSAIQNLDLEHTKVYVTMQTWTLPIISSVGQQ
jgi:hypothetical protein